MIQINPNYNRIISLLKQKSLAVTSFDPSPGQVHGVWMLLRWLIDHVDGMTHEY